jgi:hypothetical protein
MHCSHTAQLNSPPGFLRSLQVGYNHYHGRMGLPLPETEKMLHKNRPEKYVFHW